MGSNKLSIRALNTALGVTPTAAYHHFKNRSELLAKLATQAFKELAEVLNKESARLSTQGKFNSFVWFILRRPVTTLRSIS